MTRSLVFLLAGQSNMSGRGDSDTVVKLRDARVWVSRAGQLEPACEPLHRDPDAGIGPGMSFAMRVVEADVCERIILVPCAVGGTWIDRWVPGADLFGAAVGETKAALRHGDLGGILWHQGEANAETPNSASAYADDLTAAIRGFRTALDSPSAPFLAGEIGRFLGQYGGCPEFKRINEAIQQVCLPKPGCAVVSSEGLDHVGDFLHFDAAAARTLGRRYADAWLTMHSP